MKYEKVQYCTEKCERSMKKCSTAQKSVKIASTSDVWRVHPLRSEP